MNRQYYKTALLKTLTYRLLGSLVGFIVTWKITSNWYVSLGVSVADLIVKPVIYFLHELLWSRLRK